MSIDTPAIIYRKDYMVPEYVVDTIDLRFQLYVNNTVVTSITTFRKKPLSTSGVDTLLLNGEDIELKEISLDGRQLSTKDYNVDKKSLRIFNAPNTFTLEIVTVLYPAKNTTLQGLYQSNAIFCTQCEAEGFRRITYFPDRPDVLSKFTTRIESEKSLCPVMLSNGNLIESGDLDTKRHYVVWEDPFPKPSYLFALVAGPLISVPDHFKTRSGKDVKLKIFVEERNRDKCDHAMTSLKKSMRWDEERFGLEYDLDIFMIVAVDDFNMGAMENKGLNIFNSKYVLSTPESASDQDYIGIESVIAHEYFHNWTGNRVTCRDWFQLSLKEGLTVFRDQEFSSDMNSRSVQRINDVQVLKNYQFREDGGPMAHPVRPDSFLEINNFYTATVYNKGAEVIRMMQTLIGRENFRKGMDLYFERHDGQAVTCDDFVTAMSDASGVDLSHFSLWYSQAGTPVLEVKGEYFAEQREYRFTVVQTCPDTPGQNDKEPFHMPVAIGLLGKSGADLLKNMPDGTQVLELKEKEQVFAFQNIVEEPVLSFLRDFSAPVKVLPFQSSEELSHLMRYDSNLYNRWDAATRLASDTILKIAEDFSQKREVSPNHDFFGGVSHRLLSSFDDPALYALSLELPAEMTLAQDMGVIDPDALHDARQFVRKELAKQNKEHWLTLYKDNKEQGAYLITPAAMGRRAVKNRALNYLMALDPLPDEVLSLCSEQYKESSNMTDTMAALSNLVNLKNEKIREESLDDFYSRWHDNPLVLDKWFGLQAMSFLPDTLKKVEHLLENKSFSITNPNKVRALIGTFCSANHVRFHDKNGEGYTFLADYIIELNTINPQIAARLVAPLINWKRYDSERQILMLKELDRIAAHDGLSRDVSEIVNKSR